MKKHRVFILLLSALVLVTCVSITLLARGYQREQASRELIPAIEGNDTNRALKALKAQADPNVRWQEEEPLSFRRYLSILWRQMSGIHAPASQAGSAALTLAVQYNNTIVAEALIARGARDTEKCDVADNSDEEYKWDEMDTLSVSLLVVAAQHKSVSLVHALVKQGADVNALDADHKTPLFYADDSATAEALMACGAHVNVTDKFGYTTLDYRLDSRKVALNLSIARVLLKQGAYDPKALPLAARCAEDPEVLKRLLGLGRNVGVADQNSSTLLMLALDPNGGPLIWSVGEYLHGRTEEAKTDPQAQVVKLLIREGANVNFRDRNGDTPLLLAAEGGRYPDSHPQWPGVIKALLARGARIDTRRKDGATPLMVAASHLQLPLVQLLLQQGAQVNLRTKQGATALSMVHHRNYAENDQRVRPEVMRLLKSAGATE